MEKFEMPWGCCEVIHRNNEVEVSVLVIYPGKEVDQHFHKKMKEIEVILEGEVECNGKVLKKGEFDIWKPGDMHWYKNHTGKDVKILCMSIPPYDPEDVFEAVR